MKSILFALSLLATTQAQAEAAVLFLSQGKAIMCDTENTFSYNTPEKTWCVFPDKPANAPADATFMKFDPATASPLHGYMCNKTSCTDDAPKG